MHNEIFFRAISNNPILNEIGVNDLILYNKLLGKNVYVIDIYRSPIERKISEYFEQIGALHFNNSENKINGYNVNKLINRFNKLFPHVSLDDYYKERFNLSNIPEKFDFENKYIMCEENGIKYIKLRLNDSISWGHILSNILGIPITIVNDYETDKKPIADIFCSFKNEYRIPNNLLDIIINCQSLSYYYSQEEREEYINNWSKKKMYDVIPYTREEYIFYQNLCLENQSQNVFQVEHYIDIGCLCPACCRKRAILLTKARNGEKISEKIIHSCEVNEIKNIINKKNTLIQERINKMNYLIYKKKLNVVIPALSSAKLLMSNMKKIIKN